MVIHSIRDLQAGGEITYNYYSSLHLISKRTELFSRHFRFTCQCPLFKEERADKKYNRRATLCDLQNSTSTSSNLVSKITQIRKTYTNQKYKIQLFQLLSQVALMFYEEQKYQQAIQFFEDSNKCLDDTLLESHAETLIFLADSHLRNRNIPMMKKTLIDVQDLMKVIFELEKSGFQLYCCMIIDTDLRKFPD
jgi:hypothetical protein